MSTDKKSSKARPSKPVAKKASKETNYHDDDEDLDSPSTSSSATSAITHAASSPSAPSSTKHVTHSHTAKASNIDTSNGLGTNGSLSSTVSSRTRVIKLPAMMVETDIIELPDVLTLAYCGTRGIGEVGALKGMVNYIPDFLANTKIFVGCSGGSINALFLSMGFTLFEIMLYSINFSIAKGFNDIHLGRIFDDKTMGMISFDRIRKKTEQIILKKFDKVPTLLEIYQLTGNRYVSVVVNDTQSKPEYYDYITAPNLSCIEAMIMSMSAPFLFYQYIYRDERIIDGSYMDPYPILQFDDGTHNIFGISVIIKSDSDLSESPLTLHNRCIGHSIERMRSYSVRHMSPKCRSLDLNLSDISMLESENPNVRLKCYMEGYRQAEQYLAKLLNVPLDNFYGPFIPPPDYSDVPIIPRKKQNNKIQLAKMGTSLMTSSFMNAAKGLKHGQ